MTMLFTPAKIGSLTLPNRMVRSATAERLADSEGRPLPQLLEMYRDLARGGVGLIITGHMYVHPGGKAHSEMTGIYSDDLVRGLTELADCVHSEGGRVAVQINHGGMQSSDESVVEVVGPSNHEAPPKGRPAREMSAAEVEETIDSYAQAARRAKEAGFDAVQVHAAHGYLASQFLSPAINLRTDEWGGDVDGRMRFLREVAGAVRHQVGADFPVFVKLGMVDGLEGGLTEDEGVRVVSSLEGMGLDAVEISGGFGNPNTVRTRIRKEEQEACFRPEAVRARTATRLPILLVGGFRTKRVMEEVLQSGDADFISTSRPLIAEPDLPRRFQDGRSGKAICRSCNRCWPSKPEHVGIACRGARALKKADA